MARKKLRSRFDREAVLRHAGHHHPNCPAEMIALFADDISMGEWEPPLTLGQAFGIKASNHLRHKMTDYDRLPGLDGRLGGPSALRVRCGVPPTQPTKQEARSDRMDTVSARRVERHCAGGCLGGATL